MEEFFFYIYIEKGVKMILAGNILFTLKNLATLLYFIAVLVMCLMIVFENRNPVKTLAWLLLILFVPVVGILLYLTFGRNFRKQKIYNRKGRADIVREADHANRQIMYLSTYLASESDTVKSKEHLIHLMLRNNSSILTLDNKIDLLVNGSQTYPAMLDAIASASHFIHLEFYRFEPDNIGMEFSRLMMRKAKEGVTVRVIYDDVGSWHIRKAYIRMMRAAGVEIYPFMPVRFPLFSGKVNYRNHRKILVVDGEVGFVGGLNVADKYLHSLPHLGPWVDTHLRLEGEAVAALDRVFIADWDFVSGEQVVFDDSLRHMKLTGHRCLVQVASSGPDSDWATIMQVYFAAITTARSYIYFTTPYFSPDDALLTALKTAALSGVEIKIIFPETTDSIIANWNTRSYITELLEAGIRIFLYQNGFIHSKYFLVDDVFSSVGSPNVDVRSFDLNFEVAALIYDEEFAGRLRRLFDEDLKNCSEVTLSEWNERSRRNRYKESVARIFGPLY